MFGCLSQRQNYFDVERDICETLLTKNQVQGSTGEAAEKQTGSLYCLEKISHDESKLQGQYLVLHSHARLSSEPKSKVKNP